MKMGMRKGFQKEIGWLLGGLKSVFVWDIQIWGIITFKQSTHYLKEVGFIMEKYKNGSRDG